ncbi:DUF4352 domain-containing protein [Enterococcus alishanensis]
MKKFLLSMIAVGFVLTGCNSNTNNKTDDSGNSSASIAKVEVKDGLNVPFTADGIEMKITEVSSSESVNEAEKPKQLITFSVEYKNIGTQDKGMGAIDFQLVTDKKDKTYNVTEEMEAFGGVLKPEESATGKLYYLIGTGEKPTKLEYAPTDKTLKTWDLQ